MQSCRGKGVQGGPMLSGRKARMSNSKQAVTNESTHGTLGLCLDMRLRA